MMDDQKELLARETMGIQSDVFGRAFSNRALAALRRRPPFAPPLGLKARFVFIAVDPSGGGHSHFAVVSVFFERGELVVCGLESIPAKRPEDYEEVLRVHCRKLRQVPHLEGALFLLCPEANLGFESSHIARAVKQLPFLVVMHESRDGRTPGMVTTHKTKEVMHSLLRDRLERGSVSYAAPAALVTTAASPEKILGELTQQVVNYSVVIDTPDRLKGHFRTAKRTFSGKHHGNDDLAVMLQFACLVARRFHQNPRYRRYW
jgi:hypothetical protein